MVHSGPELNAADRQSIATGSRRLTHRFAKLAFEHYLKESWLEPLLLAEVLERNRKQGAPRIGTGHLNANSLRMILTTNSINSTSQIPGSMLLPADGTECV